jgi:hypothetical protein
MITESNMISKNSMNLEEPEEGRILCLKVLLCLR